MRSSRQASSRKVGKHAEGKQASYQALRGHSVGAMPLRGLFIYKMCIQLYHCLKELRTGRKILAEMIPHLVY